MCGTCNSKRSQLSQMFGHWPIEPFKELSDDLQTQFWLCDAKGKQALQNELCLQLVRVRSKVHLERHGGRWEPLSVWASLGYDVENIKNNCNSYYHDELLVDVYKVTKKEVYEEEISKDVRTEIINLRDNSLRGRLSHYASPSKASPLKKASKKRKRSSSSSSGSGSSSSSSKSSKTNQLERARAASRAKAANVKAEKVAAKAKAKVDALHNKAKLAAERANAANQKKVAREDAANQKKLAKKDAANQKLLAKEDRCVSCVCVCICLRAGQNAR